MGRGEGGLEATKLRVTGKVIGERGRLNEDRWCDGAENREREMERWRGVRVSQADYGRMTRRRSRTKDS